MNQERLDLYSDYLCATFGKATATGLAAMLDDSISHDAITRFLAGPELTSRDLWRQVKPLVRQIEAHDGVLIFDDTVQAKPHMAENDLIAWHFDHTQGRAVKGINLLNCLYHAGGVSLPVAFELVRKDVRFCDLQTRQERRVSNVTKNEQMRAMLDVCLHNQLTFHCVLFDSWFSSADNMKHIKQVRRKDFIGALKSNRLVALSEADRKQRRYTRVDQLDWSEQTAITGWLKDVDFPIRLARQVFKNKDGSSGILYLAGSQLDATWNDLTTTYQKRWQVEVFHKSLKSNAAFAKSPAHGVRTQANHLFASIVAVTKLEALKIRTKLNHFALRAKLYLKATRIAFDELRVLRASA